MENLLLVQNELANKSTIWLLFLLLGWSYGSLGKIGLQLLFYITFGGFGIWTLIRLFTLNCAINKYNTDVAKRHNLSIEDAQKLGINLNKCSNY